MNRYFSLALCLLVLPAWADMFKWTDENGKVHYSDQPPPASVKKSETVKQPKPAAPPADAPATAGAAPAGAKPAASPKTPAEQEMEFRKRRLEAAEAAAKAQKEAQAADDKKHNCEKAKAQVASLERGGRITRPGPNGESTYMSDQEIANAVVEAKKVTDTWCK